MLAMRAYEMMVICDGDLDESAVAGVINQTTAQIESGGGVVAKTEILGTKKNPRFVVTTLTPEEADAATVYRELYCARGDMENRIKEQQLDLFADRTSTNLMRSNQLRLYFSTFAYILIAELRRLGLVGTDLARAYAGTVRRRLLTVGARVYISVRRVLCRLSSSFVGAASLRAAHARLRGPPC